MAALLAGLQAALQPEALLACFIGVLIGTLVGVLPGLGSTTTMALMLPFTLTMDPAAAIIMLAGVYYGAQYGGSTTAILVRVPGEAASAVTTLEGYEMARRGRGGAALFIAAVGSWVAGSLGVVGLQLMGPVVSRFALSFGAPEMFALMLLAFVVMASLRNQSRLKTTAMLLLELVLGTVGMDPVSGFARFTFGIVDLMDGIEFIPVIMGLFGVAELLWLLRDEDKSIGVVSPRFRDLYPRWDELRRSIWPILRGSVIGFVVGLLPGPSSSMSALLSYGAERRLRPQVGWGKGAVEGVAGPESANNAATSAAMVPLLVLGLPFAPSTAVLLSGFMMQGIIPGPLLLTERPDLFWAIVASMYVGNVMLLVLNLPLVGVFAKLITVNKAYLVPAISALCVFGAYSINSRMFEVWVMLLSGVLGYALRASGFDPLPLVVALVVGPELEKTFRQTLIMTHGDFSGFLQRPLVAIFLVLALVSLIAPWMVARVRAGKARGKKAAATLGV